MEIRLHQFPVDIERAARRNVGPVHKQTAGNLRERHRLFQYGPGQTDFVIGFFQRGSQRNIIAFAPLFAVKGDIVHRACVVHRERNAGGACHNGRGLIRMRHGSLKVRRFAVLKRRAGTPDRVQVRRKPYGTVSSRRELPVFRDSELFQRIHVVPIRHGFAVPNGDDKISVHVIDIRVHVDRQ